MLFVELFNQPLLRSSEIECVLLKLILYLALAESLVSLLLFLFPSVILLVNSRCSSLKLNPHLISHFIHSLTSVLLQHSVVWTYKCSLKPSILLWD